MLVIGAVVLGVTQFVKQLWDNDLQSNLRMLSFALVGSAAAVVTASQYYTLDGEIIFQAIGGAVTVVGGYSLPKEFFKPKAKK